MADYNRPDDIPAMPTPPDPTEPRDSFVEKALNVWNWLKNTVPYWNNIITWINDTVLPKVEVAEQIGDMSKYLGEWGDVTSANIGESVSVGDIIYISKIDNNTDQPPTDNWVKQGINLDDYTQDIKVKSVEAKNGLNNALLNNNALILTSKQGEDDEVNFRINKYDSGSGLDFSVYDRSGNILGDIVEFDGNVWKVQATPLSDWLSLTLTSDYGGGFIKIRKLSNGVVELYVYAKNTGGQSSYYFVKATTIPEGFRPANSIEVPNITNRSGYAGRLKIDATTGDLYIEAIGDYYHMAYFSYFC